MKMTKLLKKPGQRWPIRLLWLGILIIAVMPWLAFDAAGQTGEDQRGAAEQSSEDPGPNPLAPADTSSPQATLMSFIDNVNAAYQELEVVLNAYEQGQPLSAEAIPQRVERAEQALARAIQTLNLSEVPPVRKDTVGLETALLLKEVLDRIDLPAITEVPDAAEIEALELEQQEPYRWRIPGTQLDIARVTEGPRAGQFLFSSQTVDRVAGDYEQVQTLPYQPGASVGFYEFYIATPGQIVPPRWTAWLLFLPDWTFTLYKGQTVWQWVGLGLAVLLVASLVFGIYRWSRRIEPSGPLSQMLVQILTPVTALLAMAVVGSFIDEQLNLTGNVPAIVRGIETVVRSLTAVWIVWVVADGIPELIIASPDIQPAELNASLIRLVSRISAVFLALLIIGYGAWQLGLPTAAVIASLGVGGLAIGLAASPTIENLIGSVNLFADRPVRVGDFCRYGNDIGTVEEIGLRSTKLRGLDRTVTTIPNGDFCKMKITTFAKRERMLLRATIGLRYETTPEQLRFVLAKLRELLLAHPRITDDPARVRFIGFGNYALNVEIFAYANTSDYSEFLAIREDLFLRVMDIVSKAGTGFAIPSQTTYLARDKGLATDPGQAAEAQVQAWRDAGTLPFPDFAEAYRQQIENTLDYPPAGSPEAE